MYIINFYSNEDLMREALNYYSSREKAKILAAFNDAFCTFDRYHPEDVLYEPVYSITDLAKRVAESKYLQEYAIENHEENGCDLFEYLLNSWYLGSWVWSLCECELADKFNLSDTAREDYF